MFSNLFQIINISKPSSSIALSNSLLVNIVLFLSPLNILVNFLLILCLFTIFNNDLLGKLSAFKIPYHNYYHNNKDRLEQKRDNCTQEKREQLSNYYKIWRNNRTEQEIINAREYARNWYRNLPDEIKIKKREYQLNRYNTFVKAH